MPLSVFPLSSLCEVTLLLADRVDLLLWICSIYIYLRKQQKNLSDLYLKITFGTFKSSQKRKYLLSETLGFGSDGSMNCLFCCSVCSLCAGVQTSSLARCLSLSLGCNFYAGRDCPSYCWLSSSVQSKWWDSVDDWWISFCVRMTQMCLGKCTIKVVVKKEIS